MTQSKPHSDTIDRIVEELIKKPTAHLEEHHFTEPVPMKCKWCRSDDIIKHGVKNGVQEYLCQKCRREFNALDAFWHENNYCSNWR